MPITYITELELMALYPENQEYCDIHPNELRVLCEKCQDDEYN